MKVSMMLNGVQLDGLQHRATLGTTMYTALSTTVNSTAVNGRHGEVVPHMLPRLTMPEITIKYAAWGNECDEAISRFRRLCTTIPESVLERTDTWNDGSTRSMRARVICSSCAPDGDEASEINLRQATAVFSLPDVFWQGVDMMQVSLPQTGGILLPKAMSIPLHTQWQGEKDNSPSLLADFATMWQGEKDNSPSMLFTKLPDGFLSDGIIQDMIFRIPKCSTFKASDPVSGSDLCWSGSMSQSWLYVDTLHRQAWQSNQNNAWTGTGEDTTSGLDWNSEWLALSPDPADGSYNLTASLTGAADDQPITVRFRQSWQ